MGPAAAADGELEAVVSSLEPQALRATTPSGEDGDEEERRGEAADTGGGHGGGDSLRDLARRSRRT